MQNMQALGLETALGGTQIEHININKQATHLVYLINYDPQATPIPPETRARGGQTNHTTP
jgi:hypothetical protein